MKSGTLRDDQWTKLVRFLHTCPRVSVGNEATCRRFLEHVLWIMRGGMPWRFLPNYFGNWNSVYTRFARWCDTSVWARIFEHFADDPDREHLLIDRTVVRAHPCAAGAPHTRGGQATQALGRSRGGFSTKIHISVDTAGHPPFNYRVFAMPLSDAVQQRQMGHSMCQDFLAMVPG